VRPTGWRQGLRSWLDRMAPFHLDWLQVEVSALCQGRCLYCPVSLLSGRRAGGLMALETFQRLEPFFSSTDLVFLQGWGEPLLHPRFWEMARRARAAGARVGFTTGGALLDEANRRALLESGVEIMGVSLAGASDEVHDHFRPGNPLDLLDVNLKRLKVEKGRSGEGLPDLHLAYLLLAGNLRDLPRVVDLAERWGARQIVVSHLSLVLSTALEEDALPARPDAWPRVQAVLEEARERAGARGIGFHAYSPGAEEAPQPACTENVLGSCFVSARGDVSPCVMTNLGLETGGGAEAAHCFRGRVIPLLPLVFGNVGDRSLREIWHSQAAREFRQAFGTRIEGAFREGRGLPEPCRHCYKLYQV